MGHYRDSHNIACFDPDNTKTELWLIAGDYSGLSLEDIIENAKDHFGDDISLSDLTISAEYVHTRCLYYDAHDPADWTNYIKLELKK